MHADLHQILHRRLPLHRPLLHRHLRRLCPPILQIFPPKPHATAQPPRRKDLAHVPLHHRIHRHSVGNHLSVCNLPPSQHTSHTALVPQRLPRWYVGFCRKKRSTQQFHLLYTHEFGFFLEGRCCKRLVEGCQGWRCYAFRCQSGACGRFVRDTA